MVEVAVGQDNLRLLNSYRWQVDRIVAHHIVVRFEKVVAVAAADWQSHSKFGHYLGFLGEDSCLKVVARKLVPTDTAAVLRTVAAVLRTVAAVLRIAAAVLRIAAAVLRIAAAVLRTVAAALRTGVAVPRIAAAVLRTGVAVLRTAAAALRIAAAEKAVDRNLVVVPGVATAGVAVADIARKTHHQPMTAARSPLPWQRTG